MGERILSMRKETFRLSVQLVKIDRSSTILEDIEQKTTAPVNMNPGIELHLLVNCVRSRRSQRRWSTSYPVLTIEQ